MKTSSAVLKLNLVVLMTLVMVAANHMASAQICNMKTDELMACMPAARAPKPLPPTRVCCAALSRAYMACLCGYKNSRMLSALGIDSDLAMELPDKCGIKHAACNWSNAGF